METTIRPPTQFDRDTVARLIAEYHKSEGIVPNMERIFWAVDEQLNENTPGLLLVAEHQNSLVGVVLSSISPSAELGRVLEVNDFYVEPKLRRKGVGRTLARRLLDEARRKRIDTVHLEVLPMNKVAASFWKSLGFETEGRTIYSLQIEGR